jgi:fructose-bisphosphate aldolase class II
VKAIVALTESGSTALWMSRHNIDTPIYALTPSHDAAQVALYRNVKAYNLRRKAAARAEAGRRTAGGQGIVKKGDMIVVTWGSPMGQVGGTNALKIVRSANLLSPGDAAPAADRFFIVLEYYHVSRIHASTAGPRRRKRLWHPAFNVNNLEQVQAIMAAADALNAPVIMQASAGARKYAGEAFLRHLIDAAVEAYPHIPVVMHQDHGQSPAVCMAAIRSGFTSVMMDGSLEADGKSVASYEYNVEVSREVVKFSHAIGVTVEAELGVLGSLETMKGDKEDGHGADGTMTREQLLTDVAQAADFVQRTQCDALAIAIGTSHGAYKFTRKPTGDILAIDRIKEIHARIPNTHLVMHGSSSVPQELLAIIREFGGDMKETYGVPVEEIQEGIRHGVRKINIDTDIRLAMTAAMRKFMFQNPSKFDPRDYLKPARAAAEQVVRARFQAFGCEGQASKIKPFRWKKWPSATRPASWPRL